MTLLTKLKFTGKIETLYVRPSRGGGFEKSSTGELQLSLAGPVGDCHSGETRKSDSRTLVTYPRGVDIRNVRQLTLLSIDELTEFAHELAVPAIDPAWLGANVVLSGIEELSFLPPSSRLQFPSGATIVVDMENYPCRQIADAIGQRHPDAQGKVVKAAFHKRGLTAWVERIGAIAVGDAVTIFIPPQRIYAHGQ